MWQCPRAILLVVAWSGGESHEEKHHKLSLVSSVKSTVKAATVLILVKQHSATIQKFTSVKTGVLKDGDELF
jgi:hypothetical protein